MKILYCDLMKVDKYECIYEQKKVILQTQCSIVASVKMYWYQPLKLRQTLVKISLPSSRNKIIWSWVKDILHCWCPLPAHLLVGILWIFESYWYYVLCFGSTLLYYISLLPVCWNMIITETQIWRIEII